MTSVLGGLLALFLAWLLFRNADPKDQSAWEGAGMALTQELLAADGQEAAQVVADLWNLDIERDQAMRE